MPPEKLISFGGKGSKEVTTPYGTESRGHQGVIFLTADPSIWADQIHYGARFENTPEKLLDDVSTDHIIRVRDLLTDDTKLLGKRALLGLSENHEMREGVLKDAEITVLVAGERFGSGSSREQAVWALLEANISAVIAKSFGPIFEKNAAYLGLLTSTNDELAQRIQSGEAVNFEEFTKDKDPLIKHIIESGGLFPYLRAVKSGKLPLPSPKENRPKRPMNIVEKRFAKAFGINQVQTGDAGLVNVDCAYSYVCLTGLSKQTLLREYGKVINSLPKKSLFLFEDHFAHSSRQEIPELTQNQRIFARELDISEENYFKGSRAEEGGKGICHRVMLEKIDPRYTQVVVATDSHTPTIGALPIIPLPVGSTLFAAALAESKIPISVPPVMRIELKGKLPAGLSIRDVQLEMASRIQALSGSTVEFGGSGLDSLNFDQVVALCNMVPEMFNAETAVTESFQAGIQYLVDRYGLNEQEAKELYGKPDPDAIYDQYHEFDLSKASPWISLPGNPKNSVSLSSITNQPKIDKAFLASCTLGLHDLEEAASILNNRFVNSRTRLIVIPSSENIMNQAEEKGILEILRKSGAEIVYESACGPCIGEGLGSVTDGETVISATNRNFPGRMGSKNADVYLGGTYLTALSAIYGRIPTALEYKISMKEIQKESFS